MTAQEAADLVRDADTLGIPLGPGQPRAVLHALGERTAFDDLVVFGALLMDLYALFTRPGVHYRSGFFGPAERFLRDSGADVQFIPSDFRGFIAIAEKLRPRVLAASTAPPVDGYLSLSLHAGATIPEMQRAMADPDRVVIAEVNPKLPFTYGLPPDHPHRVAVDDVDVIVWSDADPPVLAESPVSDVDRAIAGHVAEYVFDGCTLQTGIGGVPSMVAKLLAAGPGGDYGIHSEMFTTGLMHLHQAGKVTNRKGIYDGVSITTFAAGTADLYEWLDGNEEVRFLPVDIVNSPDVIACNHAFVSINGAMAIDLYGQVVADTRGRQQYSGIGGHEDFVAGGNLRLEDRSLICLPSTALVLGEVQSRIVPTFDAGQVVTTPRHHLDVVVTEHGSVEVRAMTVHERALAIAELAHPDFRDELRAAARALPRTSAARSPTRSGLGPPRRARRR
jgi:acyl-CoA hydrolase